MLLWLSPLYYQVICKSISFTDITESSDLEFPRRQLAVLLCYCLKLIYSLNEGRVIWSTTNSPLCFPSLLLDTMLSSVVHILVLTKKNNESNSFIFSDRNPIHEPHLCEFSLQNHLQTFYFFYVTSRFLRTFVTYQKELQYSLLYTNIVIIFCRLRLGHLIFRASKSKNL